MNRSLHVLAVQIGNQDAHPVALGRSGAWGLAIMTVGVALICYGAVPLVRFLRWRARAIATRGHVIDNVPQPDGRRLSWLPVVEFEAAGVTVLSSVPTSARRTRLPLGVDVDLLYDPADPRQVGLAGDRPGAPATLVLGVAVVVLFLVLVT